jgi:hypothetical protein
LPLPAPVKTIDSIGRFPQSWFPVREAGEEI